MSDERPVLDQVNLVVGDMPAMVAFYERLGVTVQHSGDLWDRHHRAVDVGPGIDLDLDSHAFAQKWDESWPAGSPGVVLGFRFATREAVDAAFADLTSAGHRGRQAPYDAFWGARYAIVEDPDGNPVGLMSPRDPARNTAPPDPDG